MTQEDRYRRPERVVGGLTMQQVEDIIRRCCLGRRELLERGAARHIAEEVRLRTGKAVVAYRCPFAQGAETTPHWHVGRAPTVAALRQIAAAIEARARGAA